MPKMTTTELVERLCDLLASAAEIIKCQEEMLEQLGQPISETTQSLLADIDDLVG